MTLVVAEEQQVQVIVDENFVTIIQAGLPGQPGQGVAPGGLTGQSLVKSSDSNFATAWANRIASLVAGSNISIDATDPLHPIISANNGGAVSSVFGRTGAVTAQSGDYTTSLVPEGTNLYFTDSRADARADARIAIQKGAALGLAPLGADSKIPIGYLPAAVIGGVNYQGAWNASTNTPTLASSTGTKGYYYVVSVPGSTNLDGITDWKLGDWAIFNGSTWDKIDNTDAVTAVNGAIGAVTLTVANTGGSLAWSGVQLQIPTATSSLAGLLSGADWTTFNNKLTSPMTTLGDIIYGGASGVATRLAGNTATARKFLSSAGTGSAATAPTYFDLFNTANTFTLNQTFTAPLSGVGFTAKDHSGNYIATAQDSSRIFNIYNARIENSIILTGGTVNRFLYLSGGSDVTYFDLFGTGNTYAGNNSFTSQTQFFPQNSSDLAIVINGLSGQVADIARIQDYTGSALITVGSTGVLNTSNILPLTGGMTIGNPSFPYSQMWASTTLTDLIGTVSGVGSIASANDFVPQSNNTQALGASGQNWASAYISDIFTDVVIGLSGHIFSNSSFWPQADNTFDSGDQGYSWNHVWAYTIACNYLQSRNGVGMSPIYSYDDLVPITNNGQSLGGLFNFWNTIYAYNTNFGTMTTSYGIFNSGFQLVPGAVSGYVLTCDSSGNGSWQAGGGGGGSQNLYQVLTVGNDANGLGMVNVAGMTPSSANMYYLGNSMYYWAGVYAYNYYDSSGVVGLSIDNTTRYLADNSGVVSVYFNYRQLTDNMNQVTVDWQNGYLYNGGYTPIQWKSYYLMANSAGSVPALGWDSTAGLRFYSGDFGGSPSNPATPTKWIQIFDSGGSSGFLPFYQ